MGAIASVFTLNAFSQLKGYKMLKKISFIMGFFILAVPLMAIGFDCNQPDFGARIEDLNTDGFFIKYMEKGGISYYNYTGACRMEMHHHVNPLISYAFIDNQLYARIISIPEKEGQIEDIRDRMEKNVSKQVGTQPYSMKQNGDWWVYQWFNEKNNLKYKVKIHGKTNEGKSVCYYEVLRSKLNNINDADDPASLVN
jgi:hypothetical protein